MLSIIIPSYKGAHILKKNLPDLIKYLVDKKIVFEIIVVDDGSKDKGATKVIANAFGCLFLENYTNLGKGAAVRNGINIAKGDFIIFTDVDIPFEYDAILNFLHYLDFKEFDVVVGDRTLKESNYFTEISKSRKLGSNIFSFFVGRFITTGIYDTQCGIKGFRVNAAKDIFSKANIDGFTFDVELLYIALKRNYDIKRLPVKLRNQEESSVSLLKHAIPMLFDLFRIKYNHLIGVYDKTKSD